MLLPGKERVMLLLKRIRPYGMLLVRSILKQANVLGAVTDEADIRMSSEKYFWKWQKQIRGLSE
jgi:hypothetical protein